MAMPQLTELIQRLMKYCFRIDEIMGTSIGSDATMFPILVEWRFQQDDFFSNVYIWDSA